MTIDLFKLSPAQVDQLIHIQSTLWRQAEMAARVRAVRDYYDGAHPVFLSSRQKQFIGALMSEGEFEFAHNTVRSVVDTLRERLNVSGFTVNGSGVDSDGDATPERELATLFWAWWEENRLDAQQIRLHRRAIRDGYSYVMVSFDNANQRPNFTLHQVDDGTTGIVFHRDPEDENKVLFAVRYFFTFDPLKPGTTGKERKTVYFPHEIRKYIRDNANLGGWRTIMDEGDSEWPIKWIDSDGTPLGIPLIQFENPGGSEVAQIIGLQDALNKSWLDLIAAADMAGFPLLVIENELNAAFPSDANATDDDDIEGDDEFNIAPGRAITVDGAHVHRIEGANLEQLINVIRLIIETIAGISRTPSYYLTPAAPDASGEALKQRDSGLVKRAQERQLIFGQSWSDIMSLAYRVQRAFGPGQLPDVPKMKVQTIWDSAETRQEKADAEMGEIHKRLGIPDDAIWAKLGYSPSEIAKFKATMRSDTAATTAAVIGAMKQAGAMPQPAATAIAPRATVAINGNGANGTNGAQRA